MDFLQSALQLVPQLHDAGILDHAFGRPGDDIAEEQLGEQHDRCGFHALRFLVQRTHTSLNLSAVCGVDDLLTSFRLPADGRRLNPVPSRNGDPQRFHTGEDAVARGFMERTVGFCHQLFDPVSHR